MSDKSDELHGFERLPERLSLGAGYILLGICLATTWSVFMRYVLRQPVNWTYDVSGYACLFVSAAGVSYALVLRRHINVDLLITRFHGKTRQAIDLAILAVSIFWAAVVTWGTWNRVYYAFRVGKVGTNLNFPLWTVDIIVPIGMALFIVFGLIQLQRDITKFRATPASEGPKGGKS